MIILEILVVAQVKKMTILYYDLPSFHLASAALIPKQLPPSTPTHTIQSTLATQSTQYPLPTQSSE